MGESIPKGPKGNWDFDNCSKLSPTHLFSYILSRADVDAIFEKETIETPQVAELFIQNVFRLHGFIGHFWKFVFDKLKVSLKMSSGDHPQTDGQTERVNQILEDMLRAYVSMLRAYVSERQTDWDSYLPLVEFAYNNRPHNVTGMSPFEMNYGMNPTTPSTIGMPKKCPSASEFLANLQANLEITKFKMQQAADRTKEYADRKRSPRSFEEGDQVFLQDGRLLDASLSPQSISTSNALTRKAGGRKGPEKQMKVVVDMREFSSSLPCVLNQQGMKIIPVTLEVGDYILSPDICVERKSLADLLQSFGSGRLYHQAETMTRYYQIPVLLIEFSQDKNFSFQSANEIGEDINPHSIISKLSLLVLHFPRLRIIWSRSLHATADIFFTLKSNQDEPDVDKATRVGVPTEDGLIEGDLRAENYNSAAIELLRRLPGVTDANYRSLMDGCNSLAELACIPMEKLAEMMGGNRPARMLRDFLDAKCPVLT
ncbi:hypothetical protein KP509_06G061500 [Ceratopteris richardii]|uniref:Integrase catalytic domain-containing protein n=1 Tax=Ceratopteris richardii TaxID=49495 RepID=A0A8T2UN88_CERRI|nr:hypothetical protein KP509_06G061500 [Ceratopteris richardii]